MLSLYGKYLDLKTRLTQDEEGQTLIEYALLVVLISLALLIVQPGLKNTIANVFNKVGSELANIT